VLPSEEIEADNRKHMKNRVLSYNLTCFLYSSLYLERTSETLILVPVMPHSTRPLSLLIFILLFLSSCFSFGQGSPDQIDRVRVGAEIFMDSRLDEVAGLRLGLVMNPTARIGERHVLDLLLKTEARVSALFAPEHGFRGEAGAGDKIEDGVDQESGLPVYSLYGENRKPTQAMLEEIDLLIFDMQDVGARFYTYIATLGGVIESAAEAGIPIWILDRPNPAGGDYVSGWLLEKEFESFVGPYPIPIAHGLTMGEIARMMVGERWIDFDEEPDLEVVEMEGWRREMKWPDTGLNWVPPSPNLPTFEHAYFYLGNVFYEGTTMSEGRGTEDPFLTLGDPGVRLDDSQLEYLQSLSESILVEHTEFIPHSIPGVAPNPKHQGVRCYGVKARIKDYNFDPVRTGLEIFTTLFNATEDVEIRSFLYLLAGTREIDRIIEGELSAMEVDFELESYLEQRRPYLIY